MIMLIILAANAFGYALVYGRAAQTLSGFITGIGLSKWLFVILVMILTLVCGMFMECIANILILTPILLPIAKSLGIDPVVFGLCFITVNSLGSMTPPVGVTMFTACSLMKCDMATYTKEAWPYMLAVFLVAAICLIFPQTVTFLGDLVYGIV